MKTLSFGVGLACSALGALTWIAAPDQLPRRPIPSAVELAFVELAPPIAMSERVEITLPTAAPGIVVPNTDWLLAAQVPVTAPIDPYETARDYFHAQVRWEELLRALPPDLDRSNISRELYPDYVAAVDEWAQVTTEFAAIAPPAATEPLPLISLYAPDDALERAYKRLSREDLLFEHWRISRAAWAESKRILEDRLEHGPYETTPVSGLIADG